MEEGMTDVPKDEARECVLSNFILPPSQVVLHIVAFPEDIDANDLTTFNPLFTYHLFSEKESDETYENANVDIVYSAIDFRAWLRIRSDSKCSDGRLRERLRSALPPHCAEDRETFIENWSRCHAEKPMGLCVDKVSVDDKQFEIWECLTSENESFQRLFDNMQTMALWFIEGASVVDVADPRWCVYCLYHRVARSTESDESYDLLPMGYITVFRFYNPIGRKRLKTSTSIQSNRLRLLSTNQNETRRICQALIFPPYKRQGHGKRLLECVMRRAREDDSVYEVTVEDPVPAFRQLRLLVDVEACIVLNVFDFPRKCDALGFDQSKRTSGMCHVPESLPAGTMENAQQTLKLTNLETQMCYEVLQYVSIDQTNDAEMRAFRLQVKRRLYTQFAEDIELMSEARRKAFLQEQYQTQIELYAPIATRVFNI